VVALAGEIPGVRRRTLIDSIEFLERIVGSPKPMILFLYSERVVENKSAALFYLQKEFL
jgi:hypothetical protein